MTGRVLLVWWVACLLWSTMWLAIKLGLRDLPPFSLAGWRLVVALLLLTPVFVSKPHILRDAAREWRLIAGAGFLLLGVNYALVFWGAQHVSSGLMAVLQATTPAFGACFAYLLTCETVSRSDVLGMAAGVLSLIVIFSDQLRSVGTNAAWGALAVTTGAACVAFVYVVIARSGKQISPLSLTSGQMIAGAIPLIVTGAIVEGNPLSLRWTPLAIGALLYLAIAGSIVGFWLNYWLLKRASTTSVLAISIVEPLFAVLLGALVLGETLSWRVGLGGAGVLFSAWLIQLRGAEAASS